MQAERMNHIYPGEESETAAADEQDDEDDKAEDDGKKFTALAFVVACLVPFVSSRFSRRSCSTLEKWEKGRGEKGRHKEKREERG